MTYGTFAQYDRDFAQFTYRPRPHKRLPPAIVYGFVILASAGIGHWLATSRSPNGPTFESGAAQVRPLRSAPQQAAALVTVIPETAAAVPQTAVREAEPRPTTNAIAAPTTTPRDPVSRSARFHTVPVPYERYAALRDMAGSGRTPLPLAESVVLGADFRPFLRAPAQMQARVPPNIVAVEKAPISKPETAPAVDATRPIVADLGSAVPVPQPRPASFASDSMTVSDGSRAENDGADGARPRVVPPLPASAALVQDVPVPMPRPAFLAAPVREAQPRLIIRSTRGNRQTARAGVTVVPSDNRTFFEKLFGVQPQPQRPTGTALAYAAPDAGGLGLGLGNTLSRSSSRYDGYTAIYDIAAHTVYMPDGSRLEAHSGLGANLDDPRSMRVRMRGVTPPNIYELSQRTELFHGVRAIRLNPTDGRSMFGRDGILAHTYMLGPRGDSNGCVVFRDYSAFLAAFDRGSIRRIAVVSSLN